MKKLVIGAFLGGIAILAVAIVYSPKQGDSVKNLKENKNQSLQANEVIKGEPFIEENPTTTPGIIDVVSTSTPSTTPSTIIKTSTSQPTPPAVAPSKTEPVKQISNPQPIAAPAAAPKAPTEEQLKQQAADLIKKQEAEYAAKRAKELADLERQRQQAIWDAEQKAREEEAAKAAAEKARLEAIAIARCTTELKQMKLDYLNMEQYYIDKINSINTTGTTTATYNAIRNSILTERNAKLQSMNLEIEKRELECS